LIILIILGEEYKSWSSVLRSFLSLSCYLIPLWFKYPQHPVLKHPQCMSSLNIRDQCWIFCNPSIHYAYQVYNHFIVTTCFGPLGPSSGD
jgi:hypothetical protein